MRFNSLLEDLNKCQQFYQQGLGEMIDAYENQFRNKVKMPVTTDTKQIQNTHKYRHIKK